MISPAWLFVREMRDAIRRDKDPKTMTRRVVTARNSLIDGIVPRKGEWVLIDWSSAVKNEYGGFSVLIGPSSKHSFLTPRIQPGQVLYLREPLYQFRDTVYYHDDQQPFLTQEDGVEDCVLWRWKRDSLTAMHMPREFARTFLLVTATRGECLQDITLEDTVAEGVDLEEEPYASWFTDCEHAMIGGVPIPYKDPEMHAFRMLWDSVNGHRPGCAWADNPPVWAHAFRLATAAKVEREK